MTPVCTPESETNTCAGDTLQKAKARDDAKARKHVLVLLSSLWRRNRLETPNPKLQTPKKFQAPNSIIRANRSANLHISQRGEAATKARNADTPVRAVRLPHNGADRSVRVTEIVAARDDVER
jgi:hypothetical protein